MSLYLRDLLNEKLGVISRVYQEDDIYRISDITNNFISNIIDNPEVKYTDYFEIYDTIITINYIPNTGNRIKAQTKIDSYIINVYLKAVKQNYLDLKYTLIHELVHIIQIWTSNDYENLSELDKIKLILRKPYLDDSLFDNPDYKHFIYLLYREDLCEINAWAHDAYINAFKYKMKKQDLSNQEVVNIVLNKIYMNSAFLNNVISKVKSSKKIFSMCLNILVGHLSELHGNTGQRFFDKSVFELDSVKRLRKDVKHILNSNNDLEIIADKIIDVIDIYENDLLKDKDIIINSFIEHLKYWFNKAKKQYGKAIQLGIDDATIKNIF